MDDTAEGILTFMMAFGGIAMIIVIVVVAVALGVVSAWLIF